MIISDLSMVKIPDINIYKTQNSLSSQNKSKNND